MDDPVGQSMDVYRSTRDAIEANIRAILHRLESRGFLYKPHISAGRVPSDAGYRLYVDEIGRIGRPARRVIDQLKSRMGRDQGFSSSPRLAIQTGRSFPST